MPDNPEFNVPQGPSFENDPFRGRLTPESLSAQQREYFERAGGLPIGGERIIRKLRTVEVGEGGDTSKLEKVLFEALAFREGLEFGSKGPQYMFEPVVSNRTGQEVVEDPPKVGWLQSYFLTVENSTRKSSGVPYIDSAIDIAINDRIQRASDWRNDPGEWREDREVELKLQGRDEKQTREIIEHEEQRLGNEYVAIPKLVELALHVQTRKVFDTAFTHRMMTCEDPASAAKLGIEIRSSTPDGQHWKSLFTGPEEGQFGFELNKVFEEIVKFGLEDDVIKALDMEPIPGDVEKFVPKDIYVKSFGDATAFGVWANHLLSKADGWMDVVSMAWRIGLVTETIDTLGESKSEGRWALSFPPIGNSLMTFLGHLPQKREVELHPKGVEKFISHSGLPISLQKWKDKEGDLRDAIPDLCRGYFHESTVEFDKNRLDDEKWVGTVGRLLKNLPQKGRSDYDPSYRKLKADIEATKRGELDSQGKPLKVKIPLWDIWLYGRMSMADPDFPWHATDQPNTEAAPGELAPGSFGNWQLKRFRSFSVLGDIRSRPSLQELGDPDFFVAKLRNWTKVLGNIGGDEPPEANPRAWWVLGVLHYHQGGGGKTKIEKESSESSFRIRDAKQSLDWSPRGHAERNVSAGDVLYNAMNCGFLREIDAKWINKKLDVTLF